MVNFSLNGVGIFGETVTMLRNGVSPGTKLVYQANARSHEMERRRHERIALGESILLLGGLAALSWALPIGGLWLVWRSLM